MKTKTLLAVAILSIAGASVVWRKDVQPIQLVVEAWDIDVAVGLEMRMTVPIDFDLYVITSVEGYHTTAGTSAGADSTTIEVRDITNATVIDTVVILEDVLKGLSSGLTYEVGQGDEIAFKVLHTTTTAPKGLRMIPVFTDENSMRQ